ncbi:glycosyltransferase family 2 protein [Flavobacterium sp. JP2137]|uniref:glycosyltransferase family 2 protein n=1 Tax=Flavobacterium sp. JP2137 TaxID=3414510 RepID=UPI003D2FEFCE
MEILIQFYQYFVFFYATVLVLIALILGFFGYLNTAKNKTKYTLKEEQILLEHHEIAPPISVIAGAFNEEVVVVDATRAFLDLDYPNYEVVIVNDGSKDATLSLLIDAFDLVEVPHYIIEKVLCKPIKRVFKSTNPLYHTLTVVDKINGGTKADAMNAGLNIAKYDYFINTDVDCILAKDTLTKVILPVLDSKIPVIAVGATMRMVNGCEIDHVNMTRVRPPRSFFPIFQETEYLRSYLITKMGWAYFNALPNVSGGFGLFDKNVVIAAGGYDPESHAEDMDMTLRIIAHMRNNQLPYRVVNTPHSCCWTEGPPNLKILYRQRSRWGRGLLQIFFVHHRYLFNRKYGRMGLITLPFILFFELLAPIIEIIGLFFLLYLFLTAQVNMKTFWLMFSYVYLIGLCISIFTISLDFSVKKQYRTLSEYLQLIAFSSLEAFVYHPFIMVFTLVGYVQLLTQKEFKWGKMTRKGFTQSETAANLKKAS